MNTVKEKAVEVSVTVNGRPLSIYPHEGRFFIESREGTEYAIEIKNPTSGRMEAVVAVDGLSVMNGEKASVGDCGYVIPAYGSIKIKGYRKSMEEVGSFKFTRKEQSYAAGKGGSSNVGVIAVAVWSEKHYQQIPSPNSWGVWSGKVYHTVTDTFWRDSPSPPSYTPPPVDTAASLGIGDNIQSTHNSSGTLRCCTVSPQDTNQASFRHGTTWGESIQDKVATTTFDRDHIISQFAIYYDSKENLESLGIRFTQEKQINFPTGFPVSFAVPPPGWKS
jgi:hypothetical protein